MPTQTPIHVSNRFFSKASRYFGSLETAVAEIIQNAYRASLPILESGVRPRLDVSYTTACGTETVVFRDYGMGIQDIGAALSIAVSSWDKSVEEEQDPAGMGLCAALAFSKAIKIRSDFGELIIDGKLFFEDDTYRDGLLDKILPIGGFEDGGTEISMLGPKNSTSQRCPMDTVKSECFYHGAIDVWLHYPNADTKPEPFSANTFRTEWHRAYPDGKVKGDSPIAYKGYEVWEMRERYHSYENYLRVIWHGQLISVDLTAPELRRQIEIPGLGEVSCSPVVPFARNHVIVIDHGIAPVTPKLPDRKHLVLDEKTCDFIWGYLGQWLQRDAATCIEEVESVLSAGIDDVELGELSTNGGCNSNRTAWSQLVNGEIWKAVWLKLIRAYEVTWPVWDDNGDCDKFYGAYRRQDNFPAMLAPAILVRSSDGFLAAIDFYDPGSIDHDGTQIAFGGSEFVVPDGCVEINGAHIPENLAINYSKHSMPDDPIYDLAVLVVNHPSPIEELVENRRYGGGAQLKQFLNTGEAFLNTDIYRFPDSEEDWGHSELEDLLDHNEIFSDPDREQRWQDEAKEFLSRAQTHTTVKISGLAINSGDGTDADPGSITYIGRDKTLVSLTYDLCTCMCQADLSGMDEPDHARDDIQVAFAQVRQELSGIVEIGDELSNLARKFGVWVNSDQILHVEVDAAKGMVVVVYKDRGETKTLSAPYTA